MAIACVFSPVDKDNKPYRALPKYKKEFGRETGTRAFLKALSPSFQKRNEKVLEIDAQGVATIQSALRTRDMRDFVGFEQTKKVLEKQYGFNEVENTADNFRMLVNEAKNFNDANPDYIAYPVVEGSNIKNTIFKRTPEAVEAFNNRYGSLLLNDRLLSIFEPLGLKVGDLATAEQGYSGITDFSNAKSIAGEFINLIRVANSMSGQLSMSEEFSHLIVRMLRDQPNMQRLINAFTASPEALKTVLGEDYQGYVGKATSETGDINYSTLAEEAVGRLLQGKLQEEVAREFNTSYIGKLWKRLVDYIKRAFSSYNTSDVEQAITEADQTLGNLAKNILNGSTTFNRKDIEKVLPNNVEREMQEIKAKAIANGTFMKAPNGKPTNLTERQWLQVRTKAFKDWFGDWINAPENASKVIDENGEPLVMYHASKRKFTTFDREKINTGLGLTDEEANGFYFSTDPEVVKTKTNNIVYSVFLNARNINDDNNYASDDFNHHSLNIDVASVGFMYSDKNDALLNRDKLTVGNNTYDELVVFNPNQIKSATDNNGMFSTENDDIMYHLETSNSNTQQTEKDLNDINKIIEDAINVETKKTVIINNDKAIERAERKIKNLNAVLKATPEGKLKGLINYALAAVTDLGIARDALLKSAPENRNFGMLRGVWSTILSYNNFIDQLGDIINSEDEELKKLIQETQVKNKDEVLHTLGTAYRELSALRDLVKSRYKSIAFDSIEEFFKPFFNVEGKFIDSLGRERTLRQLIEEASGDIGFVDTYFMTMSNSGDLLLQLFDEVVKKAKATARYDTIEDMHDIIRLMLKARDMGTTSFEWMFEHDNSGRKTGNYISAVNTGQFEKDKREFMAALDEKYGENPTGENAKRKIAERKAWNDSHSVFFGAKPNATIYHNGEFDRLSTQQKEILMDFMQLKQKFDKRIPPNKVSTTKAIQMRRTSQQRLLDSLSDPARAFENIKETIAKELTRSSDDDAIYGERTGLRSFDGSEFKVLPVLYTARLSNPEELSTDVFSSLAAYSYSTNIYKQMEKVVDPLEVARNWVSDKENRRIREVSNGRGMVERVKGIVSPIYKNTNSNSIEKLDNFMDSQVYQRYYKDSDKTINVMGRELKAGKLVNKWLSVSSAVQLGFNALAHLANAATGVGMQNIEAFSGQYFNAKELAKADAAYLAAVKEYIHDIEAKNPRSKLALFDQLFDIKQEFGSNVKNQMNRLFEKLFGKSVAFLGQTCGDHWLYNRTAIAMCLRKKVKTKDGSITSLWEALQVENAFSGDDRIKKLTIDAVDAETGEKIDREYIRRYSAKINEINHRLFGVYNTDDMVAAQRVALGRCVLQYRQWIVPLFARRFQSRRYVAALGEYEEGYYRTVLHVLAGLRGGMEGLKETWEELDDGQKRNIYRAITEMTQFFIIWAIANFCSFGKDDPDRVWALKFAEYMAQRELHELGNLTPSFTMGNEILKTVKSPASILNTTQAALNLTASILDPRDWFDEIESGKYEGMSTLHKNFLKAPFPILAPFNQLDRVLDNIEETTRYYARSY